MITTAPTTPAPDADQLCDHHLRALVRISAAVAAAHDFDEVLELAADAARAALGCAILTMSRFEPEHDRLRVLVCSQDGLAPELRRPQEETYELGDYVLARRLLAEGTPFVSYVDDPAADPAEVALLRSMDMSSSAAAPIARDGRVWGELYVATAASEPRVVAADVEFLTAVCGQIATALSRAELFSHVARAAFEDPLTGLANRRAFEDALNAAVEAARADGSPLTLLLGDLDGLKRINDGHGHEAGDAALVAVADALHLVDGPGVLAARIGGDEFCVLLSGRTASEGEQLACELSARLGGGERSLSVSWGVASLHAGHASARELLRDADHAQYASKRGGGRRRGGERTGGARVVALPSRSTAQLSEACLAALDALADADRDQRLTRIARELAVAVDAAGFSVISRHGEGGPVREVARSARRPFAMVGGDPESVRSLQAALLAASTARVVHHPRGVVLAASAVRADGGADGIALYGDAATASMDTICSLVRLLLHAV